MTYRDMTERDIVSVVPLYMDYYNTQDGDGWHSHFYGKLGYRDCNNLVLKSKFL